MFSLMDKVPSGIEPMLKDLEEHIINAGLADMVAAAETITTVCVQALTSYTLHTICQFVHVVMVKVKLKHRSVWKYSMQRCVSLWNNNICEFT